MPPILTQKIITLIILVLLILQPFSFVFAEETTNQNQSSVLIKLICDDSNCIGEITAQVSEDVVGVFPFVYDVESNTTLVNIAPDINLIYTYNTDTTPIISYILTDHLNSTNIITDQTGAVIETTDYYPYGTIRLDQKNGSFSEQRKYIGQEFDTDTNLSYLNARYYDGKRGQFISQDPQFWNFDQAWLLDPQNMNSYSYARNNPITLSDPTGKSILGDLFGGVKTFLNSFFQKQNLNNQIKTIAQPVSQKTTNTGNGVLSPSAWKSQMPDRPTGCFDVCSEIVGYRPNSNNAINTVQQNRQGLKVLPTAKQGVETINNYLSASQPIIVGVNRQIGYDVGNNNKATNHFVVIMGYGYDNGNKYYNFFDTGTSNSVAGTSPSNRLYLNPNDFSLSGSSQYTNKNYIVTEVRPR